MNYTVNVYPKTKSKNCRDWQVRVFWVSGGKRHVKTKVVHDMGKKAAMIAGEEYAQSLDMSARGATDFVTFADRVNETRFGQGRIKEVTHKKNYGLTRAFSLCCDKPIEDITPADIDAAYVSMLGGRTRSGRKATGTYAGMVHVWCKSVLNVAVRDGIIKSNPFDDVEKPKNTTLEKSALTKQAVNALLDNLEPEEPTQMALILCLTQGLRRSEACNLLWDNVGDDSITVSESKTAAGVRTIPISSRCREALEKRMRFLESCNGKTVHVCAHVDGKTIDPHSVSQWFARNRDELGVPGMTTHQLRHTYLTMLAEADVHPNMMQALAGHASPVTTLKIYTHVHDDKLRAAVDALDAYMA